MVSGNCRLLVRGLSARGSRTLLVIGKPISQKINSMAMLKSDIKLLTNQTKFRHQYAVLSSTSVARYQRNNFPKFSCN